MAILRVEVTAQPGAPTIAKVGDVEFPIEVCGVQPDESGRLLLTMVLAPDDIQIGTKPAEPAPPAEAPTAAHWGDGTRPDPRVNIPGWEPEHLGGQVAGHAEARALNESGAPA